MAGWVQEKLVEKAVQNVPVAHKVVSDYFEVTDGTIIYDVLPFDEWKKFYPESYDPDANLMIVVTAFATKNEDVAWFVGTLNEYLEEIKKGAGFPDEDPRSLISVNVPITPEMLKGLFDTMDAEDLSASRLAVKKLEAIFDVLPNIREHPLNIQPIYENLMDPMILNKARMMVENRAVTELDYVFLYYQYLDICATLPLSNNFLVKLGPAQVKHTGLGGIEDEKRRLRETEQWLENELAAERQAEAELAPHREMMAQENEVSREHWEKQIQKQLAEAREIYASYIEALKVNIERREQDARQKSKERTIRGKTEIEKIYAEKEEAERTKAKGEMARIETESVYLKKIKEAMFQKQILTMDEVEEVRQYLVQLDELDLGEVEAESQVQETDVLSIGTGKRYVTELRRDVEDRIQPPDRQTYPEVTQDFVDGQMELLRKDKR